ncbi:MAG: FAD-dependent oxidoreductase [Pseudomonadota bacterium]
MSADVAIVGGGLLGSAIGYGLARAGLSVTVLDEGDNAFRAARGNFGLVWVQGKGAYSPAYSAWTRRSATLWPAFAAELAERTGVDLQLSQPGGIELCLSEAAFEVRREKMEALAAQNTGFTYEMLGRNAVAREIPGIGPDVVGGSWSPHDGHCDPLRLLRALQAGIVALGGQILPGARVTEITRDGEGFRLEAAATLRAERVVLAAGLGNAALAPMIGLSQPVRPVKGQILVTERMAPLLPMPTTHIRQTGDGTVMLGDSHEEVGHDIASTTPVMREIADRARRSLPALARAKVVRSWGALRVMTPDGLPIYDASPSQPGAYAVSCHSGVTLAAAHALDFAEAVAAGALPPALTPLSAERFDVQAA